MYSKKEILVGLVIGLLAVVYGSFYFDRGLDPFDSGLYAAEASRILDGKVYGKDFLAPYGPGRYYLIALLFALFGASLKTQAAFFLALRGAVAALMFLVSRRVLPLGWSVLMAAAVIVAHGALHKSLFPLAVLANLAAYHAYRRRPGAAMCAAAGALCGATALFRVDAGVFGALGFVFLLLVEPLWDKQRGPVGAPAAAAVAVRLRRLAAFCAGAAAITLPAAVFVAAASDLPSVLGAELQRIANLSRFAGVVQPPGILASLAEGSLKRTLLALLIPAAPIALAALAAMCVIRRLRGGGEPGSLEVLAIAVYGLPALNQVRITPSFNHLLQAIPPALIAATLLLLRLGAPLGRGRAETPRGAKRIAARALLAAAAALPAASIMFYTLVFTPPDSVLPGSIRNRWAFTEKIELDRAGIFETPQAAAEIEAAVAAVERLTRPGEPILTSPFSPVIHFLSQRPPAVKYLEPFYYFGNEAVQMEMIASLEAAAPQAAVMGGPVQEVGGQSLARDAPLLHAYLVSHYVRHGTAGRYTIWIRK